MVSAFRSFSLNYNIKVQNKVVNLFKGFCSLLEIKLINHVWTVLKIIKGFNGENTIVSFTLTWCQCFTEEAFALFLL